MRKNVIGIIISSIVLMVLVVGGLAYHFRGRLFPAKTTAADTAVSTATVDPVSTPEPELTPATEPEPEPEPEPTPEPTAVEKSLIVNLGASKLMDLSEDHEWTWLEYSHSSQDQRRVRETGCSNAVSLPFVLDIPDEFRADPVNEGLSDEDLLNAWLLFQVQDEILRSPIFGDMVARGLVDLKVENMTLGEINPWLQEFVDQMDAAYAVDHSTANTGYRGVESWLTLRQDEEGIFVSREYRCYAAGLCTLLNRLAWQGVIEDMKSTINYALSAEVVDYARRTVENGSQEDKPVFLLQYMDEKTETVYLRVGFNRLDKRFEVFEKKAELPSSPAKGVAPATTPTPTPTPTPSSSPTLPTGTGGNGGSLPTGTSTGSTSVSSSLPTGSSTPEYTPEPKPTPTPEPDPTPHKPDSEGGKEPEEDPAYQDNAPIGGGKNNDPSSGKHDNDVSKPDGTTIVQKEDGSHTTAAEMNDPTIGSEDPKNDDGHKVDKVDGSETPPVVTTPITKDPEVGGSWGQDNKGNETVNNGNGNGTVVTDPGSSTPPAAPDPVVTEVIDDPF